MKSRLSSLFFLAGLTASHGQNTWTNSDGDFLWNATSANWAGPVTWTNGDDAVFDAAGAGLIQVEAGTTAGSLTFNASGYDIGGDSLILTGSGLVTSGAGTDNTISSALGGSAGLNKAGTGWLRLTGGNTYTGTTTVAGGALFASNASGPSLPGNVTLGNGSGNVFLIPTADNQFANGSVLNFNNGLGSDRNAKFQLRGTSQTIHGLNSASTNNISIIQNDEGGTPGNAGDPGTATLTIDSNTNDTFYGLIRSQQGTLNLIKAGSGTLTLVNNTPGDSGFGAMTVTQGAVHFGNGEASAAGDGNVRRKAHGNGLLEVAAGASVLFHYDRRGDTLGGGIAGGGDIEFRANSSASNTGSNDYILSTSNDSFTGNITVTDARLRTQNTASPFGDQSQATITTSGNGQVMYHADPGGTYQYQLFIGGLGYYESNGTRLGALRLEHGSVQAGSVTLTGDAGIGSQDGTLGGTISGVIGDNGDGYGIIKLGVNTITLTAANTYSGDTVVQTGTLALSGDGSIANSSTIDVRSGAFLNVASVTDGWTLATDQTLIGNGTVTGDIAVEGIIAPGNSAGTLTIDGALVLAASSVWQVEIGGISPSEYDRLIVNGDLTAGGEISLSLVNGFAPSYGDSFQILDTDFDQFVDGGYTFNSTGAGLSGDLEWDFSDFANTGYITVIPEPSSVFLAGLGALGLLRRRR